MADRTCNSTCMQPVWDLPLTSAGIVIQLENGGRVRIRPARPSDDDGIKAGFARLSEESRYNRFFNARSQLSDSLATSLTDIDHTNHFAWGVFDPDQPSEVGDESGFGVAAARLIRDKGSTSAEAALTVTDDYQGRGIGRFLMELLVATAADVGTDILRFEILRPNRRRTIRSRVSPRGPGPKYRCCASWRPLRTASPCRSLRRRTRALAGR
jgi:GNAT superfamily N-acetyltransferase